MWKRAKGHNVVFILLFLWFLSTARIWAQVEGPAETSGNATSLDFFWRTIEAHARLPRLDDPDTLPLLNNNFHLDGIPDEPEWQNALVWRLDYEISLAENRKAPVNTLVMLAVTHDALVFAFIARDTDIQTARSTLTDRDRILGDDNVSLVLDTFGDQRHAYEIFVNPRGVQADALRSEFPGSSPRRSGQDFNFDFFWESVAKIYPEGYVVEGSIPFRYLRFKISPESEALWRIGAFRDYPRDFQYRMSVVPWDYNLNRFLSQLPPVHVRIPVRKENLIQLVPYTRGLYERQSARDGDIQRVDYARDTDIGLDVKFQPSPEWVLDGTVLPDFSQVETDAFQITSNIRFAPFYPEKRPFFLERTDLFQTPLQVVYTRTMLDPLYGFRATGKTGAHTLAFLHMRDRWTYLLFPGVQKSNTTIQEDNSFNTILRYRYDLETQSALGLLMTSKEYPNGYNRSVNLDMNMYLSNTLLLTAQGIGTWTRYPESVVSTYRQPSGTLAGWGYWTQLSRQARTWRFRVSWQEMDKEFRADLGFLQQVGTRELQFLNAFDLWPDASWFKRVTPFIRGRVLWDRDNALQNRFVLAGLSFDGSGQTSVHVLLETQRERVGNFYIESPKTTVNVRVAPIYWFRGGLRAEIGYAPDYKLVEKARFSLFSLEHEWLFWRSLEIRSELRYQRLWQTETLQDALVNFLSITWQLTPRLAYRQIVQWQQFRFPDVRYRVFSQPLRSNVWEAQSLIRYRINYATALYVGTYGRWPEVDLDKSSRWNVFLKFSYLFNI